MREREREREGGYENEENEAQVDLLYWVWCRGFVGKHEWFEIEESPKFGVHHGVSWVGSEIPTARVAICRATQLPSCVGNRIRLSRLSSCEQLQLSPPLMAKNLLAAFLSFPEHQVPTNTKSRILTARLNSRKHIRTGPSSFQVVQHLSGSMSASWAITTLIKIFAVNKVQDVLHCGDKNRNYLVTPYPQSNVRFQGPITWVSRQTNDSYHQKHSCHL